MKDLFNDWRCSCGKLLFRGIIISGSIEAKCRYCKEVRIIDGIAQHSSPDRYVIVANESGEILRASRGAIESLGYSNDELLRMQVGDVIIMLSPNFFDSMWKQATERESGRTVRFESLQCSADKTYSNVRVESAPVQIANSDYIALLINKI